jgi:hypothetical protein
MLGEDDLANMPTSLVLDIVDFMERMESWREVYAFTRETGGAPHCQMGATPAAAAVAMDWLDTIFAAATERPPGLQVPGAAMELLRKHHGARVAERVRLATSGERSGEGAFCKR